MGGSATNKPNEHVYMLYTEGIISAPNSFPSATQTITFTTNGLTKWQATPLNFVLAGAVIKDGIDRAGAFSVYWQSSIGQNTKAGIYPMNVGVIVAKGGIGPHDGSSRHRGESVRCLAR